MRTIYLCLFLLGCSTAVQSQNSNLDSLIKQINAYETSDDYNYELHLDLIAYFGELYQYSKVEKWNEKQLFFKQTRRIIKQGEVYITSDFEMNYYLLDENFALIKKFDQYMSRYSHGVSISYREEDVAEEDLPPNWNYSDKTKYYKLILDKRGEPLNSTEFSDVLFLSDGLLSVTANGKTGIVDSTGKIILPMKYKDVEYCWDSPRHFIVSNGEAYGVVDRTGRLLIPYEYSEILRFKEGGYIAAAREEKYGVIDSLNNTIIPFEYGDNLRVFSNEVILKDIGEYDVCLMNAKGEEISRHFDYISPYQILKKGYSETHEYENSGIINTATGKVFLGTVYSDLSFFSNHIWLEKGGLEGAVDYEGNIILPIEFKNIEYRFFPGRLNKLYKNGKFGIYDENNELIFDFVYEKIRLDTGLVLGLFGSESKTEIIKVRTQEVLHTFNVPIDAVTYDNLLVLDPEGNKGFLALKPLEEETSLYDRFNIIRMFDGFSFIRKNGKVGVINHEGEMIIPAEYDDYEYYDLMTDPSCDIRLKKEDKWFRFNILGESIPVHTASGNY